MSQFPALRWGKCALLVITLLPLLGGSGLGQVAQAQSAIDPARTEIAAASVPDAAAAELPEAPTPVLETATTPVGESSSLAENLEFMKPTEDAMGFGVSSGGRDRVPLNQCPYDTTHARECRVHWRQLIITTSIFNAFQNAGNLYGSYWYRYETTTGPWFDRWFNSVLGWRWNQWKDGNPFLDVYVAHPMMGGITNSMWIQNDPKGMTVEFGNTRAYWHSRMRATVYSTAYSFEWKFGPFGEAGVGHNGDHTTDIVNGVSQNDTGVVELVTTPVGGLLWTMAEDALDKHVVRRLEKTPRNPFTLLAISFLTPARATANIFRFRPPWYRDGREVKARSFWSDPPGTEDELAASEPGYAEATPIESTRKAEPLPVWPHYGGVHEFGAWWGLSLMSGPIWGYAKDIKYMPIDVNYSYLLHSGDRWNFRYSPEMTALAMLDQPVSGQKNPQLQRKRIYGSGLSPMGFRLSLYPDRRVQPFVSTNGGFIYFADRVLLPQGSQFMYTIDFGGGLTIYRKPRQSVAVGYRYQHLSNANISQHSPGTDANTFYVQVSRFRTKGYR